MAKNLVLLAGTSASGKSSSLMNLRDQTGVMYLCCESGKELPFPNKFKQYTITDPMQVYEAFSVAETKDDVHTIVVDSLNFMMDMYESVHVLPSTNTMKMWGEYSQFFKNLMQQYVAKSTKNVIFTAHTKDVLNESEMVMETKVPVKGALNGAGIEAWFTVIIGCKRVPTKKLEPFKNSMLEITEDNIEDEFKYVYQTRLTKETVNERIRGPIGMFKRSETYTDNDVQKLLDHLTEYYEM